MFFLTFLREKNTLFCCITRRQEFIKQCIANKEKLIQAACCFQNFCLYSYLCAYLECRLSSHATLIWRNVVRSIFKKRPVEPKRVNAACLCTHRCKKRPCLKFSGESLNRRYEKRRAIAQHPITFYINPQTIADRHSFYLSRRKQL